MFSDLGNVGCLNGIDDVVKDHMKSVNAFYHLVQGLLFRDILKYHAVHGRHCPCAVAAMPAMKQDGAPAVENNPHGRNKIVQTEQSGPGTQMMQQDIGSPGFFDVVMVTAQVEYFPDAEFFQFPEAVCRGLVGTIHILSDPVEILDRKSVV